MRSTKTYKVSDIAEILQISRTKAYEIVNRNLFPVIHIGKAIRIPIEPFERWMFSEQTNQLDSSGCVVKVRY